MKPFNLIDAMGGELLITRDGRKVLDFHYFENKTSSNYQIYAIIKGDDCPKTFDIYGKLVSLEDSPSDLFIYEEPKIYYTNVYEIKGGNPYMGALYNSLEMAEKNKMIYKQKYLKTIQVTI